MSTSKDIATIRALKARIEELEDQWYPPAHMDAVQERTIDPLRAKVKELEAALKRIADNDLPAHKAYGGALITRTSSANFARATLQEDE